MQILFFALGSHGDVHPMVGLATAMRDRGHSVAIATSPYYQELLDRAGVPLLPLGTPEELLDAMRDPDLWHPQRAFDVVVERMMLRFMRPIYELIAERYVPGETVVVAPPTAFGARVAQEKLGVPLATVHLAPAAIQSVHVAPVLPPMLTDVWVPVWLKQFQYWAINKLIIDRKCAGPINQFRGELGLPATSGIFKQWWNSSERLLCLFPDWFAPMQPDWPAPSLHTGFPLWDESSIAPLSPTVEEFLLAGEMPIVFTPGSAMLQGEDFFRAAVAACEKLGRRGILLTRHPDQLPSSLPPTVRHFDFVPLSKLLPRSAAIVHHGGIGTVAQGLASGIPHVTMPMAHDQHDNAARLVRLGVGRTIPRAKFKTETLATALATLLESPSVTRTCQELADRVKSCDALRKTCDAIEALAQLAGKRSMSRQVSSGTHPGGAT